MGKVSLRDILLPIKVHAIYAAKARYMCVPVAWPYSAGLQLRPTYNENLLTDKPKKAATANGRLSYGVPLCALYLYKAATLRGRYAVRFRRRKRHGQRQR
ncbi:hypothetical protein NPIL_41191 [Nephila pilipes]|uniref:Uncharacterized protein n=1 Tax=Nephila pilipes TaxID=299642 RepID=A0A8X6MTE1_NEPPI|nr:hypothetical protein NPIL_41191 [Nephila pilipes]